jgi:transcriptional regulator with XRE-family HTH domain
MSKSVYSPTYARFLELLVQARKAAGLTQQDLATHLNRPQSFVSKYENRERRLDVVEFLQVAAVLELDAVAFIEELQRFLATYQNSVDDS